jgi:predicted ABC-type exoprotein transport system permease subunit
MTLAEFLTPLSFIIQVATNVIVVAFVMPMFRKHRLRFFALIGFSAMLGIFVSVMFWKLDQRSVAEEEYIQLWCALTVLGSLDLIIYAVGIVQMVRFFQNKLTPNPVTIQSPSDEVA